MKKGLVIGIVIIVVIVLIGLLMVSFFNNRLSDKKVLSIIMPEIENYCNKILDKKCAVCSKEAFDINSYSPAEFPKKGQYLREDRSASNNVLNKSEFWLEVHIPLNYINENHSEGSGTVAQFKMDIYGNVIYRQVPMTLCK